MAKKKYTLSDVLSIIESDGIGNAIENLIDSSSITDPDLEDLWSRAKTILDDIREHIELGGSERDEEVGDDGDDGDDDDDDDGDEWN